MPPIPRQYDKAIKQGPIRTVLMDGGGNDILLSGRKQCKPYSQACADLIQEVKKESEKMRDKMIADGVEAVVWLGYYYTHGLLGGGLNKAADEGARVTEEACRTQEKPKCYYVDPREAFKGKPGLIMVDGVHPTNAGSKVLANLIWDTMQANDIEQNR